jgi:aryl-alcohol dehydrogenase-like predicted oxidoreductase
LKIVTKWVKNCLAPIAKDLGIALEQLVLSWELHQKYVAFVIVGATNTEQALSNLKANEIKLSSSVLMQMENAYKELENEIKKKFGQSIREFRGLNEKYY